MGRSRNDKGAESPRPLDPPGLAARFTRSLRSLVAVLAAPGRNRADTGKRSFPSSRRRSRRERPLSVHPDGATSLPSRLRCSRRYARCAPRPSHAVSRHGGRDSARPAPFHVAGSACLRLAQAAQPGEGQACCSGGNERGCPLDPSRTMQAPQGAKRLRSAASVPRAQRAEHRKSQPAQRATRVSRTVFRNPDGRAGRGFLHNCGSDSSSSNSCS